MYIIPKDYGLESFRSLYMTAFEVGLKGCTTFKTNPVTGSVLSGGTGGHCCNIDRELD